MGFNIGHLVRHKRPGGLHAGSGGVRNNAVVVSTDPIVLCSTIGDMVWRHIPEEDLISEGGYCNLLAAIACLRRMSTELRIAEESVK